MPNKLHIAEKKVYYLPCNFSGRGSCIALLIALVYLLSSPTANAQSQPGSFIDRIIDKLSPKKGLFESEDVLQIELTGNLRDLLSDKSDNPKLHPLVLSYREEGKDEFSLSVKAKTRGHFRRTIGNCTYPPLQLNFNKSDTLLSSLFKDQDKLKLVMPCCGDEYIIREWLVYKLYNLVTPKSFRARLVQVQLNNLKKKKSPPFYGILLEEEKQMAKRNKSVSVKRKLNPEQTDREAFVRMAVFEYLIGNTDWSVQYQQNIKLIAADSNARATPVPYDFDHAGLINTPYAKPAEQLLLASVRERRYRGYCAADPRYFDEVVEFYNKLKKDIYSIYTNCTLLSERYVKTTVQYLDEFYRTINNAKALRNAFSYPCDETGTGNIVIKGLRKDN